LIEDHQLGLSVALQVARKAHVQISRAYRVGCNPGPLGYQV